jgi:dTDP-L-rhamnose 4-epimerase
MRTVLVTGGSGFIGTHVTRALAATGYAVRILDLVPPADAATQAGTELMLGDVQDPAVVAEALSGMDVVCHHAATVGMGLDLSDLPRYTSNNDLGTAVLLAGMFRAATPALVLASSMVVYGEGAYRCPEHGPVPAAPRRESDLKVGRFEPPCPICAAPLEPGLVAEDTPFDPRSGYAVTKVAQEYLSAVWARECGTRAAILRYHNVYGSGLPADTPYSGVAAIFRSAALAGRAPMVFEDGSQRRDFVHVRDVAAANVAAVEAVLAGVSGQGPLAGHPVRAFNVASGIPRTVLDLASHLAAALHAPPPQVTGQYRVGDVRHVTASCERLRTELDWAPEVTFEDGVRELAHDTEEHRSPRGDQQMLDQQGDQRLPGQPPPHPVPGQRGTDHW